MMSPSAEYVAALEDVAAKAREYVRASLACEYDDAFVQLRASLARLDAVATPDADTVHRGYEPDPDGFSVQAQLTEEGAIVDVFDASGQCVHTFARTANEFIEAAT